MKNTTETPTATVDTPDLTTTIGKFTEFLDSVESLIPDYQVPHGNRDRTRAASTARYAVPLMQPTITAINSVPRLRDHNTFDPEAAAAALQYRDALRSLGQRMAAVGDALIYSGDVKLAASARSLLHTYSLAQRLVRDPEGVGLRPYVEQMSLAMMKNLNRRKAPAAVAPPAGQGFLAARTAPDVDVEDILEPDGLLPDDEE